MSLMREQFAKGYFAYALIRGLNFVIENDIRQALKNDNLTFPGFRILWILYFDSNIRMTDLTFFAQTNISNIFRQLTKLNEEGLVKIENGNDARTREVNLTEEGRKLVQTFIDNNSTSSELKLVQLIDEISQEDYSTFIKVSTKLSTELIGKEFTDFVQKSVGDILHNK